MASAAGLSAMHFAAQFRTATGLRPHDYLLTQRIQKAKCLMKNPNVPLYDIAISVGFRTQAHFTTVFKKLENMTPDRWRRNHMSLAAAASAR
jgi:AraC-like DNA-binding protein